MKRRFTLEQIIVFLQEADAIRSFHLAHIDANPTRRVSSELRNLSPVVPVLRPPPKSTALS